MSLVRTQISAGVHQVEVNVAGRRYIHEVTIAPSQWVVLNVTDLSRS